MSSRFTRPFFLVLATVLCVASKGALLGEVTIEQGEGTVTVKIDGQLFTEYVTDSGGKPILWPIIGPGGLPMTRSYPMKKVAGEATDHPHQRSLWFTHGAVNGIDFWMEGTRAGKQIHKEFVRVEGGQRGTIVTRNDWVAPDGKKVLTDERKLAFFADDKVRVIDFDITLIATEGPVTFGDTKEGSFGIRIAESMRVERGGKAGPGRILNSEGESDDGSTFRQSKTWGKRAKWVDYSGPVEDDAGKTHLAGIAILNHPSSFRYPTYWHVRPYGLFAPNPFGVHDFVGGDAKPGTGDHKLASGEQMRLKYRVIFHEGPGDKADIEKQFTTYAAEEPAAR